MTKENGRTNTESTIVESDCPDSELCCPSDNQNPKPKIFGEKLQGFTFRELSKKNESDNQGNGGKLLCYLHR